MTGGSTYLTALQQSVITGLLLAGCFVGSLFAGQLCERLSRKFTIIIASGVFCIGAAVQTGATGYDMILAGRFVAGLGVGSLSMAVPLYLSELAPKEIRGRLISLQQLTITIGLMVAFWVNVGTESLTSDAAWRVPLGIQIAPAAVLFVGTIFLPFSPRWLIKRGRNAEALSVLARLHSAGDETAPHVVTEYEEIIAQVEHERAVSVDSYLELFKGTLLRRLILGVLIQVFQQFTGINSIMYYAPTIFQQAGVEGRSAALIASGVNGVLNVLATIPAILFLDRLGRRFVLISGALVMGTAMLLCGIVMGATGRVYYNPETDQNNVDMSGNVSASYFCIVMVYIFVAGFAYSWGPCGWVYPAEIYPLSIRAKGTSLTTAANWLMNFIISLSLSCLPPSPGVLTSSLAVVVLPWLFASSSSTPKLRAVLSKRWISFSLVVFLLSEMSRKLTSSSKTNKLVRLSLMTMSRKNKSKLSTRYGEVLVNENGHEDWFLQCHII
ncbi:unnamed protein product [Mucor fragilis]